MNFFSQIDDGAHAHEDWAEAGLEGLAVFCYLDSFHRKNPNAGVINHRDAAPVRIALRAVSWGMTKEQIGAALERLSSVGLIELRDDGSVFLPKWKDRGHREAPAKTERERKAEYRARAARASTAAQDEAEAIRQSEETDRDAFLASVSEHAPDASRTCPGHGTDTSPIPRDVPGRPGKVENRECTEESSEPDQTPPPNHPSPPSEPHPSAVPDPSADLDGGTDGSGSGSDPGPTRSISGLGLAAVTASCRADEHPPDRSGVPRRGGAEKPRRAVG